MAVDTINESAEITNITTNLEKCNINNNEINEQSTDEKPPNDYDEKLPGKLVNFVSAGVELLRVEVVINNQKILAIIDSGAAKCLMSADTAEKLNLSVDNSTNMLKVLGREPIATNGKTTATIKIGDDISCATEFLVVKLKRSLDIPLILGMNFLRKNHLEISVKDEMLIKHLPNGGTVDIYLNNNGKTRAILYCNIACYASKDVMLNGTHKEVPFSTNIMTERPNHLIMYTDDHVDDKLTNKVRGLSGIANSDTKVVLMSSTEHPIKIKKGQIIGSISSVLELDEPDDERQNSLSGIDLRTCVELPEISLQQQTDVYGMLGEYKAVFSTGDTDINRANFTEHRIRLRDDTPIYQRPRRFPPPIAEEIERQCGELHTLDIIEPCVSAYSSPVHPVRKKDGSIRLCIDYRRLNHITIPDKFPVPNLNDSIFGLKGTKFFTRLDLVRGYYQLPIEPDSRKFTAFSTVRNHWQFKRLSFGLRNAPSAFQREIQSVLSGFPSNKVICYIDDILIMSQSFEEHIDLVSKVLKTLLNHSIKIKPGKCDWFRNSVEYLGHVVSETGITKTNEYVNKVENYPKPKTVGDLRKFLGFINFQRKFLPNCSVIQKPLSCLTGAKKSKVLEWNLEMEESFDRLKRDMMTDLELAYPNYEEGSEKLELWVDGSGSGSGAYLAQMQNGIHRVIGFASMTFTPTQQNYSTLERELCALRWGIKTFKPFLYGVDFVLYTDHQPLVYLHTMKLVCSRLTRMVQELSDFSFEIRFISGRFNTAADLLSRVGCPEPPLEQQLDGSLPEGMVLDGPPVAGGGDSLFVSLLRALPRVKCTTPVPHSASELRVQLIDLLIDKAKKYQVELDRKSRKSLKLMRCPGVLPCLDVLLAASDLFKVKIFVYFWSSQPVIYQSKPYENTIHIQCISGIHFNPLIQSINASPIDTTKCTVYTVKVAPVEKHIEMSHSRDNESDALDTSLCQLFSDGKSVKEKFCSHTLSSLPLIYVSINNYHLCGVFDTAAEVCLVTLSALEVLSLTQDIKIVNERVFDVVGYSGERTTIEQTVELTLNLGNYTMSVPHKFGIVSSTLLPHCFLFGLDLMSKHDISLDFHTNTCKHNSEIIALLLPFYEPYVSPVLVVQKKTVKPNTVLQSKNFSFKVEDDPDGVRELSLLIDDDTIKRIQVHCSELKLLKNNLLNKNPSKNWPERIKKFSRYASKLSIVNGIVVYNCPEPIIVVPHHCVVEIALFLHFHYAHVGRDKLLNLMFNLLWHPTKYTIVSDVCTTCHSCQTLKECSSNFTPPTLKIETKYPFELVAIDLISLPKTRTGFIGCLMVVDHFTKWVVAVPIKDKKSSTIINALSSRVLPVLMSVPSIILSDNGPEFIAADFKNFLQSHNITHKLTSPYCPTSNGAIERVNRSVKNLLRSVVDDFADWDIHLPKAVTVYNQTMHSEIKMSPSEFLITQAHKTSKFKFTSDKIPLLWKTGNPRFLPFKVNDLVLMKIHHLGFLTTNKLSPNYRGPYRITQVNDNGVTYRLLDEGTDKVIKVHHSKLRLYKSVPRYLSNNPIYAELTNNNINNDEIDIETYEEYAYTSVSVSSDEASEVESIRDGVAEGDVDLSSRLNGINAVEPVVRPHSVDNCKLCEFELRREVNSITNNIFKTCDNYLTTKCVEISTLNEPNNTRDPILPNQYYENNARVADSPNASVRPVPMLDWRTDELDMSSCSEGVSACVRQADQSSIERHSIPIVSFTEKIVQQTTISEPKLVAQNTCRGFIFDPGCNKNVIKIYEIIDNALNDVPYVSGDSSVSTQTDHLDTSLVASDTSKLPMVDQCIGTSDFDISVEADQNPGPRTRSQGPVRGYPNVQKRILERARKNNKEYVSS